MRTGPEIVVRFDPDLGAGNQLGLVRKSDLLIILIRIRIVEPKENQLHHWAAPISIIIPISSSPLKYHSISQVRLHHKKFWIVPNILFIRHITIYNNSEEMQQT